MMDVSLAVLGGIVFVLLGAGFGYQSAMMRERKAGGGRTASELKTELEDYQQNVSDHFMESAALLQGMTEQYKKIYEHMARGAQDLCETQEDRPELAALRNGLLAAALASSTHEDLVHVGKVLEAQAESRAIEDEQQAALDAPEGQAAGATEAASAGSEEPFAEAGGEAENDAFADTSSQAQAQAQAEALASEDVDGAAVEVAEIEPGCAVDGEVAQAEDADMATSGATEAVAAEASVGIHTEADADSDSERVAAPEPAEEPPAPGWAERYRSA